MENKLNAKEAFQNVPQTVVSETFSKHEHSPELRGPQKVELAKLNPETEVAKSSKENNQPAFHLSI